MPDCPQDYTQLEANRSEGLKGLDSILVLVVHLVTELMTPTGAIWSRNQRAII